MRGWLVAADDRTGAFEVAAELARAGATVSVSVDGVPEGDGVVDLGTRVMDSAQAAKVAATIPAARWSAHKIDSTLRGNWADELRARGAHGAPTVIVAAWPAMGRTCLGGVVHVHGSAGPAVRDQMPEVVLLAGLDELEGWLADGDGGGIAAVDVADTSMLHDVARIVAAADVLVAGPAGAIGAVYSARFGSLPPAEPPVLRPPFLVVCGSATAVSREQVERLCATHSEVRVVLAPPADGQLSPDVARELVADMDLTDVGTLVVIGGDTAAALLGDRPRRVGGYAAPGMPWSLDEHGGGPVVVTKAGGFGGPDALIDLLAIAQFGLRRTSPPTGTKPSARNARSEAALPGAT